MKRPEIEALEKRLHGEYHEELLAYIHYLETEIARFCDGHAWATDSVDGSIADRLLTIRATIPRDE